MTRKRKRKKGRKIVKLMTRTKEMKDMRTITVTAAVEMKMNTTITKRRIQ